MSSSASFEVLLETSRQLEDDFIDEDIQEMQEGGGRNTRTVMNRMITVRGKRQGQPIVLSYADFYSTSFSPTAIPVYERRVLEVFVAQPKITFEGTCRERGMLDNVARWFGAGGTKGPHPIFSRMRMDAERGCDADNFQERPFGDALEALARRAAVKRVLLMAGSGLTAVTSFVAQGATAESVLRLVDDVRAVTATL